MDADKTNKILNKKCLASCYLLELYPLDLQYKNITQHVLKLQITYQ